MKIKSSVIRLLSLALALMLALSILPSAAFAAGEPGKAAAYAAYYEFLQSEINGLGKPTADSDYYQMFTSKISRTAKAQKILHTYLLDITGDGIEELFIKEYFEHESSARLDGSDTEWVRIYSYVNGSVKRIGQTKLWAKSAGGDSWSYYEPAGYVGNLVSSWKYPYISDDCLYYCTGTDGKTYLCDSRPTAGSDGTFAFYAYNGTLMEKLATFRITFIPEWQFGSIHSSHGYFICEVNGEKVTQSQYTSLMNAYCGGDVIELVNNDYNDVLSTLANEVSSWYTPSSWAQEEVSQAIELGFVPENLQKGYTQPITRAEFCALAASFYESVTGSVIEERAEFNDTADINVQKIGGLGVVNGVGNGSFAPDALLTRQEAAAILSRLAAVLGHELPEGPVDYADSGKIAAWAVAPVGQIAAAGVMNGVGDNRFDPLSSYTREQAILTILRLNSKVIA